MMELGGFSLLFKFHVETNQFSSEVLKIESENVIRKGIKLHLTSLDKSKS